jgi:hypothetical protein
MSVGSWEPDADLALTDEVMVRLLRAAADIGDQFGLSATEQGELAGIAQHGVVDWAKKAKTLDVKQLISLVRFFTLAEKFPGWQAGAKSPVIPLVAELRRRDAFAGELHQWIKANTENRFLPYGSLLDRL